jgi:hypothetical protein
MTNKFPFVVLLIFFVCSINGCSIAGRAAFLQLEDDSFWHSQEYIDTYSDGGKISTFSFNSDSLTLKVHTDRDGNVILRQPSYLRPELYFWGPPFVAFLPNPFSLSRLFPSSVQYDYTIWLEIQSRNKILSGNPSDIQFYSKDGTRIKQQSFCLWKLNPTRIKWIADSTSSSLQFLNDTVAVSIKLTLSDEEAKSLTIRFTDLFDNVPDLMVHRKTEWFYIPLTPIH